MSSFEFNKIAGAVLGTLLLVMGLGIVAETIFHRDELEQKGYVVELPDEEGTTETAEVEDVIEPIAVRLANASVSDGESLARRCASCHSFDEGGANKVGPNLWGVVMATPGQHEGFGYSSAMTAYGADNQWTYANLDSFLTSPKSWVEGTSMSYNGLSDPEDRAAMILYLRSLATTPADLPAVEASAPAEEAAADKPAASEETETAATAEGTDSADTAATAMKEEAPAEVAEAEATTAEPAAAEPATSQLASLISAGDVSAGQSVARRCAACHSFEEGGANRVGPNLWNIVGATPGSVEGYRYSSAMTEYGQSEVWSLENLNGYLENPRSWIPGNKMSFAGLRSEGDRTNILAYLQSLSN